MKRLALAVLTAALITTSGCSDGIHSAHSHSHDSHIAPDALTLSASKWKTDEALRHGMNKIRALVLPYRAGGGDLPTLAAGVQGNIEYLVNNCKLEPKADAALHVILGELFEGIALIDGEHGAPQRTQGVEKLLHALEQYGRHFDHPGWEELHAAH